MSISLKLIVLMKGLFVFANPQISPSILSADFMNLERDIRVIEEGGCDLIHVDVMDGHFVPNLSIGVPHVAQLKKITKLPLDVHLMISNPLVQVPWYLEAGADILTVHYESFNSNEDLYDIIALIEEAGVKPAISLKPDTPVEVLKPFLPKLYMVLIMSVYPGFSGQSYIPETRSRVEELVELARVANPDLRIQVDGGIGLSTIAHVAEVGADIFVCGNAVMKAEDPARAIHDIRNEALTARKRALS